MKSHQLLKPSDSEPRPEGSTPERKYLLDRYEGLLLVGILGLVLAVQFKDKLVAFESEDRLQLIQGEDSRQLGPLRLLDPPDPLPLPARDLNQVSRRELLAISGIGPAMADAIIGYREENGSFRSMEELERVPGIGPKRREMFSRYLMVDSVPPQRIEESPDDSSSLGETTIQPLVSSHTRNQDSIVLNKASRSELTEIPGIGETFADRIVREREKLGRFRSWEDLDRVSGVGPKRLENLQSHATID